MTGETHIAGAPRCQCQCGWSSIKEQTALELIADVERRYPEEWLAFVIPRDEDQYAPEHGFLIAHSDNDSEVWDTITHIPHTQLVHVYFNGTLATYLKWLDQQGINR